MARNAGVFQADADGRSTEIRANPSCLSVAAQTVARVICDSPRMRIHLYLALGLGISGAAHADNKSKTAKTAASSKDSADGTGEVRSINVHSVALDGKTPETGNASEHTTVAAAPVTDTAPPSMDEDLVRERVTKGMRKYQKPIDDCTAAAHKRKPALAGELALTLQITERKVALAVAKDGIGDPALVACLQKSSKTWELPAASLTLPWSVSLAK